MLYTFTYEYCVVYHAFYISFSSDGHTGGYHHHCVMSESVFCILCVIQKYLGIFRPDDNSDVESLSILNKSFWL